MTAPRDPLAEERALRAKADLILEAWAADPDRDAAQMARAVIRLLDRAALAPRPPETATTAFAWLIERGQQERQVPPMWWAYRDLMGWWTPDPNQATRYESRDAAEEVIAAEFTPLARARYGGPSARAVEHGFIGSPETADAGALDAQTRLSALSWTPMGYHEPVVRLADAWQATADARRRDATPALDVELRNVVQHGLEVLHAPHFGWGCNAQNCSGQAALDALRAAESPTPEPDGEGS